jgi:mRNA-degrading endonuclease RelE of RelBE toxin-antitoxin system
MKHNTTSAFWKLHDALPANIRELAKRNYERLKADANHPSIQFKKLSGHKHTYASARVGDHYRAVCILTEGDAVWFWIGSHETYNKLIKQLD